MDGKSSNAAGKPAFVDQARQWFEDHGCRRIRCDDVKYGTDYRHYEYFAVDGRLVLLAWSESGDSRGQWCDLFVPVSDSNKTGETLAALESWRLVN